MRQLRSAPLQGVAPAAAIVERRVKRLEPLHNGVRRGLGGVLVCNFNGIILELLQPEAIPADTGVIVG